jgi:hypothetical protein
VRYFSKTISLLFLCLAQFFVPISNLAFELPCDEEQNQACHISPCCPTEVSSQMACCDQTAPAKSESAPAPPASPLRIYFDLAAPIPFAEVGGDIGLTAKPDDTCSSFNTNFAGNQLYKLIATFLI